MRQTTFRAATISLFVTLTFAAGTALAQSTPAPAGESSSRSKRTIVYDLPVPGGPWITLSLRVIADRIAADCERSRWLFSVTSPCSVGSPPAVQLVRISCRSV